MRKFGIALAGTLAVFAFSATTASAAIVCNEIGDCWHVKEKYDYKPEFGVRVYPDEWKWADTDHDKYRWREHEGRGYWNPKGVWIGFYIVSRGRRLRSAPFLRSDAYRPLWINVCA